LRVEYLQLERDRLKYWREMGRYESRDEEEVRETMAE
jgi:hypothetical protein